MTNRLSSSEDQIRLNLPGLDRPCDRVVVIGASAGGLRPLRQLVSRLGRNFPVPVLVVLHMGAEQKSMLPGILTRAGDVPVSEAAHREPLSANRIYTPRPDHHLLLTRDTVFPSSGPKENGHRPSIDGLFRASSMGETLR